MNTFCALKTFLNFNFVFLTSLVLHPFLEERDPWFSRTPQTGITKTPIPESGGNEPSTFVYVKEDFRTLQVL